MPRPLYMMTAQAVVKVRPDSRRFFDHANHVDKKRPRCCVQYNRKTRKWDQTPTPCPTGVHDHIGCSAIVQIADPDNPHRPRVKPENSKERDMLLLLNADGEHARTLMSATQDDLIIVRGQEAPYNYKGRFGRILYLTHAEKVSEQAYYSRLAMAKAESKRAHRLKY